MKTIFDYFSARAIATFMANNPSNAVPYLGATLFPAKKKLGLDLAWIKGARGLPVSLQPSAFDAKATLRDRIGFDKVETEMPFFREAMRLGEKDRQELLKLQENSNDAYIMPLVSQIYNDIATLVSGADVIPERQIMQLLSSGEIRITSAATRQDQRYDYRFNPDHKETITDVSEQWSSPTANIAGHITGYQDKIEEDTGVRPKRGLCTRKTWGYIMRNQGFLKDMNPVGWQNVIVTDAMMRQYLLDKFGLTIVVYNKKYALLDGSTHQFYPDDYFTLFPEGNLGTTWYGTTPEEADLMSGSTAAEVQIVNTGVAITTIVEPHPVNVNTIVSEIVLPSFETMDTIFIAKVA
ncbi:Phage major capsid protein E [Paenibacillus algorifonticola]|uniref:Phage major capsid protein E n=1 Tax=Paenibacillus algorifonticola TaxID=684063 RepID=A0A1I2GZ45_9BACL|nr:major capsid protein [Paenibacillus algorifonticola]SFF23035.1 Phage major capsid protein E [Paenibacillus algorifonticola]